MKEMKINVWNQRELGIDLSADQRAGFISKADAEIFSDTDYPFVQIINVDAFFSEDQQTGFVKMSNEWLLHDYGDAASIASPHKGKLNRFSEQITAAEEVVKYVFDNRWQGFEIVAGTRLMKRFVWIEAKRYDLIVSEYNPSADDQRCYDLLEKRAQKMGINWKYPSKESKESEGGVATGQ